MSGFSNILIVLVVAGDSSWKKLSQALDVASKIYGLRVDSLFHEALKVLGGLHRTELDNGQ